jgi:S1-C subfamily serine protease
VLGNPGLPIGSEAYAVGSPYGLFGSLSAGVISGRERSFRSPDSGITVTGLLQFDAAVNPGNSGGPLLDRAGRVVGIVIALLNPSEAETFAGIGLAVPIDAAGGAGSLPPY